MKSGVVYRKQLWELLFDFRSAAWCKSASPTPFDHVVGMSAFQGDAVALGAIGNSGASDVGVGEGVRFEVDYPDGDSVERNERTNLLCESIVDFFDFERRRDNATDFRDYPVFVGKLSLFLFALTERLFGCNLFFE